MRFPDPVKQSHLWCFVQVFHRSWDSSSYLMCGWKDGISCSWICILCCHHGENLCLQLWCCGGRGGHEKKASRWWWNCDCWLGLRPQGEGQKEVADAEWPLCVGSCLQQDPIALGLAAARPINVGSSRTQQFMSGWRTQSLLDLAWLLDPMHLKDSLFSL